MKLKKLSLILMIAISNTLIAQTTSLTISSEQQETVYIKGFRFTDTLIKKWISEYSEIYPEVLLDISGKNVENQLIEVVSLGKERGNSLQVASKAISFGRYAVLPIAGNNNLSLQDEFKKKKLNEKRLKELFFEKDILDDDYDYDEKKEKYDVVVYSGNNANSVSRLFAGHFGYETNSLKGKKIAGDDIYLNDAVKKDVKGVSFNNLNYIFDIESRKLNDGIALLPLDIKKEYAEVLNEKSLDKIIALLESKNIDLIPIEELFFVLPEKVNPALVHFIEWALSDGQKHLNSFGFLQLDAKSLAQQKRQISELGVKLLANR